MVKQRHKAECGCENCKGSRVLMKANDVNRKLDEARRKLVFTPAMEAEYEAHRQESNAAVKEARRKIAGMIFEVVVSGKPPPLDPAMVDKSKDLTARGEDLLARFDAYFSDPEVKALSERRVAVANDLMSTSEEAYRRYNKADENRLSISVSRFVKIENALRRLDVLAKETLMMGVWDDGLVARCQTAVNELKEQLTFAGY